MHKEQRREEEEENEPLGWWYLCRHNGRRVEVMEICNDWRGVSVIAMSDAQCPKDDVNNNNISTSCKETEKRIPSHSGGSDLPNRPFNESCDLVSWGGINNNDNAFWWPQKSNSYVDGGGLLAVYLNIMKWDLYPKFPFRRLASST